MQTLHGNTRWEIFFEIFTLKVCDKLNTLIGYFLSIDNYNLILYKEDEVYARSTFCR